MQNDKNLNGKEIEDIKEEYDFDDIKNTLYEGNIPWQHKFLFVCENKKFLIASILLGLNEDTNKFPSYLCPDQGHNILTENSLWIHIKTGNIFYDNFNTNESFWDKKIYRQKNFLTSRIWKTYKTISLRIAYGRGERKNMIWLQIRIQNTYYIDLATG